jgi:transcriptional regulator with XRE-family HTH domain
MRQKQITGPHRDISLRLRAIREMTGYPVQREFASALGFNVKSLSQWESGQFRIPIEAAKVYVVQFGISLDFIYLGRLEMLPHRIARQLESNPWVIAAMKSTEIPDS